MSSLMPLNWERHCRADAPPTMTRENAPSGLKNAGFNRPSLLSATTKILSAALSIAALLIGTSLKFEQLAPRPTCTPPAEMKALVTPSRLRYCSASSEKKVADDAWYKPPSNISWVFGRRLRIIATFRE